LFSNKTATYQGLENQLIQGRPAGFASPSLGTIYRPSTVIRLAEFYHFAQLISQSLVSNWPTSYSRKTDIGTIVSGKIYKKGVSFYYIFL
jgi:hypothetical protein